MTVNALPLAALLGWILVGAAVAGCSDLRAGEVSFTSAPKAEIAAGNARIRFSASAPTDVEVAILAADGKVVRHLAAGLLGKHAPEPLVKDALVQDLLWDGMDDSGQPAAGGPFNARVRLGMRAAFDGFLGFDPKTYNPLAPEGGAEVRALAVGPAGELFVFFMLSGNESYALNLSCAVFSRGGKYLRTILPYPAHLPEEKLANTKRVELSNGQKVPYIYQHDLKSGSPGRGRALFPIASESAEGLNRTPAHRAIATADGRVAFVAAPFRSTVEVPSDRALMVMQSDGAIPPTGAMLALFGKEADSATLALSPDEKTVYASGMISRRGNNMNQVVQMAWENKAPKPFVKSGLKNPLGVATGPGGHVYVADHGQDRIAVFDPAGAAQGEIKTKKPVRVEVHPRSGAVYVLGGEGVDELLKFEGPGSKDPIARMKLPSFKHRNYTALLALDASSDPPVLWAAPNMRNARFGLLRIEDQGAMFSAAADVAGTGGQLKFTANHCMNLSCSRSSGFLNVGPRFYDTRRKVFVEPGSDASKLLANWDGAFGLDGCFYVQGGRLTIRLGPDLKALPFPNPDRAANDLEKGGKDRLLDAFGAILGSGSARLRGRGITADRHGQVFSLLEVSPSLKDPTALWKYGPDGRLLQGRLIDTEFRCVESVRLDLQGNIYVATSVRPGSELLPAELVGKVPADPNTPLAKEGLDYYPTLYGSIVKFGPQGGVIAANSGGTACNYSHGGVTDVKGAQWIRLGITGTLGWDAEAEPTHHCACQSSRFDVDDFGRVFYPDAARFRVGVLDTGGNEIGAFGSYGNADSAGAGSAAPLPEIPFAWPQAVAVDNQGMVFIGDRLNRRVVMVKLAFSAEQSCKIPTPQ